LSSPVTSWAATGKSAMSLIDVFLEKKSKWIKQVGMEVMWCAHMKKMFKMLSFLQNFCRP
jgi:hypothetical protein